MDTVSTLRDLRSREVRVRSLAATGLVGFKLGIRPGVGPVSTLWGTDPGPDSQPGGLTAEGDHRNMNGLTATIRTLGLALTRRRCGKPSPGATATWT